LNCEYGYWIILSLHAVKSDYWLAALTRGHVENVQVEFSDRA